MIHPLGIQNIVVSSGSGQANFYAKSLYKRIMLIIVLPSGTPTFSYYITDNSFSPTTVIIDSEVNQTAPQTYIGPVPTVNPCTIFIYGASMDGTWQMVNYLEN